ncbi:hypothetical protein ACIBAH_22140 [Streptomyces sp. NPDC051445]|uniref:hypothetical protein n=1 Tax=Streptomyces sp. NPDC051445 TaxID=3365653 RepID=UPI00378DAB0C
MSRTLGEFRGGLADEGAIGTEPGFTDSWCAALGKGRCATRITAAWGPAFLSGSAESTARQWRAATLPQRDLARRGSGNPAADML